MKWALVILAAGMSAVAADKPPSPLAIEENSLKQLLEIRRVYVDRLTGGETAAQMRDILLSSLESSKLFVLTENQERADAILKGAAEDMVFTEVHSSSDSVNARANVGSGRSTNTKRRLIRAASASAKTKAITRPNAATKRSPPSAWSTRMATSSGPPRRKAWAPSSAAPAPTWPTRSPPSSRKISNARAA